MIETYTVTLDGDTVGNVSLETLGLYYRLRCRCRLPEKQRVNLYADGEDLGILVPDGGFFCLTTKVPQKRFLGKNMTFRLVRKPVLEESILIPLDPNTPFSCMDRLQEARFVMTADGPALKLPIK